MARASLRLLLADRIGRLPVLMGGFGALVAVYLLLWGGPGGWPLAVCVLGLYGEFYAGVAAAAMTGTAFLLRDRDKETQ